MRLIATLLVTLAGPALAQSLTLRDTWPWPAPESLSWDAELCGLWIAGNGREVAFVTPDGTEERRISGDLFSITAIEATPQGLLTVSNSGQAQWLSRDGAPLGPVFGMPLTDAEGIATTPGGPFYAVEDDPDRLSVLTPLGAGVFDRSLSVPTSAILPEFDEPQGIAVDTASGHLLIVDDEQGSDRLYVLSTGGALIGSADLSPYGRDAEGVALHPASGTLWIAFDSGNAIAVFDYVAPGGAVAAPDQCVPPIS